jgi:hypothetical protein
LGSATNDSSDRLICWSLKVHTLAAMGGKKTPTRSISSSMPARWTR